jgi:prepilin-type N-terminal cleavage/methylation domain-containing protein
LEDQVNSPLGRPRPVAFAAPWFQKPGVGQCWFRSGFTWLELLVALTVLALLAGLLLPTLASGKKRACDVQCRSHLVELGLAARLYSDANHGRLPRWDRGTLASDPTGIWHELIAPADFPLLRCPANRVEQSKPGAASYWWNPAYNGRLVGGAGTPESGGGASEPGPLISDREPWHGHRNGLFLDGRVVRIGALRESGTSMPSSSSSTR